MAEEKPKKEKGISKDMTIAELVSQYPETIEVLLSHGMGCFGCGIAQVETLEQGCEAHGIDAEKMMKDLQKAIDKKKSK